MSEFSFGFGDEEEEEFDIPGTMMIGENKQNHAEPTSDPQEPCCPDAPTLIVDNSKYTVLRPGKKYMNVKSVVTRKICEENNISWSDVWIVGNKKTQASGKDADDPNGYSEWDCQFVVVTGNEPHKPLNLTCSNVISATTNKIGGGPQEPTPNEANRIQVMVGGKAAWIPPRPDSTVSKTKRKNGNEADATKKRKRSGGGESNGPGGKKNGVVIDDREINMAFSTQPEMGLGNGELIFHNKPLAAWGERPEPPGEPDKSGSVDVPKTAPKNKQKKSSSAAEPPARGKTNAGTARDNQEPSRKLTPDAVARGLRELDGLQSMAVIREYMKSPRVSEKQRGMFALLDEISRRTAREGKSADEAAFYTHTLAKLKIPTPEWSEPQLVAAIQAVSSGDKAVRKVLLSDWKSIQGAFNELFYPEFRK